MTENDSTNGKLTVDEHMELLTGFDEVAIEERFGKDIDSLRFTMSLRALAFTSRTRNGQPAKDAYKAVMSLTLKELGDLFADDADEPMPDEPVTEPGKDATHDD